MADHIIGPPLPEIISRKDAVAKGLKRYFLGMPCKYGHIAERLTDNRQCCACKSIRYERDKKAGRYAEWKRTWRTANPDLDRAREAAKDPAAKNANRRAERLSAPGRIAPEDVRWVREAQRYMCAICGDRVNGRGHIDHIQPMSEGGSNSVPNLQLLCAPCNLRKP